MSTEQREDYQEWSLIYKDYDPEKEKSRESLLAVGNGYLGMRGAMEEASASDSHYPGTYLAGLYNRLVSKVAGKDIVNEDFVNCPDSTQITFRIAGGKWFDPHDAKILSIRRELDLRNGVLLREMVVEDETGKQTEIISQRLACMDQPHLLVLRYALKPLNYSGDVELKSEINGQIINDGVARYRSLNQQHLEPVDQGFINDLSWIQVETVQSEIDIALASKASIQIDDPDSLSVTDQVAEPGKVSQVFSCRMDENETVVLEKLVSIYSSKPDDSEEPLQDALTALEVDYTFAELLESNVTRWREIWNRFDIRIEGDQKSQMLIRLHLYHLIVTASPHNVHIDAGIPARGLHGEAYRGHIFWDELYILPLYNLFLPEVARSILLYRYRRLDEARKYAKQHGYKGAMFPWQSGSDGREETQVIHLNPLSGEWGDDYSSLQRHISIAIAYNVWYYFQVTADLDFMKSHGAEMFLDICRFWASKCVLNEETQRYEISRVMGPDEFHEEHPLSENGGVKDNAYTNLMVAWLFGQADAIWRKLDSKTRQKLADEIALSDNEISGWQDIAKALHLELSDDGIIAQFEGYLDLKELDWDGYREKYGNIYRLDRILKAEGKSPDDYQLAKQADTLMTFYNLNTDVIRTLMDQMGYETKDTLLKDNYQYYINRTSHGSTLSRVVHAFLALPMGDPELAWTLYADALASDYTDIQGGTTAEGIHAGVMGGTALMAITAFAGFDFKEEQLTIVPHLPKEWDAVAFGFSFRGHQYSVRLTHSELFIKASGPDNEPARVVFLNKSLVLQTEKQYQLEY